MVATRLLNSEAVCLNNDKHPDFLSGLAGSVGPLGAAVFLSLGLPPVAYVASEASTATSMHIVKTIIMVNLTQRSGFCGPERCVIEGIRVLKQGRRPATAESRIIPLE